MFSAVGWDLVEGGTAAQEYPIVSNQKGDKCIIVRRNEFEHARATMSVVIQDDIGELHVYCKVSTIALEWMWSSNFFGYLFNIQ